jgi:hypothetical protein
MNGRRIDPTVLTGLSVLVPLLRTSISRCCDQQRDFTKAFASPMTTGVED